MITVLVVIVIGRKNAWGIFLISFFLFFFLFTHWVGHGHLYTNMIPLGGDNWKQN